MRDKSLKDQMWRHVINTAPLGANYDRLVSGACDFLADKIEEMQKSGKERPSKAQTHEADSEKERIIRTLCQTALNLAHLNASNCISRDDNNKIFELPYLLRSIAENIINEYDERRGLWICVHCVIIHAGTETKCTNCGTERGEWSKISSQPSPSDEDYRIGLPAEALRLAWPKWETEHGAVVIFRDSTSFDWWQDESGNNYEDRGLISRFELAEHGSEFDSGKLRPYKQKWSEVERLAAQKLGSDDAKTGRKKMFSDALMTALGIKFNMNLIGAYDRAYEESIREEREHG